MLDSFFGSISEFFSSLDVFGLGEYEIVFTSFELIALFLGNSTFVALIMLYLGYQWGAQQQKKIHEAEARKRKNMRYEVKMKRRIF